MTLAVRVIPCLDVKGGRVVKGLRFENLRDAGDPVEAAARYEAEGADEVTFLDVAAAGEGRGTLVHLVERVAEALSIPFTVGGGVRSVEDAAALLSAGADRVGVNTAAVADPTLLTRLAERFGSQCLVLSVDAKRVRDAEGVTGLRVTTHGGSRVTERDAMEWIREAVERGAGEILLTSVDADGTQEGFDLELLRQARRATDVPIVASGGAGTLTHFAEAVMNGMADAVLAASVFHDRVFSVGEVKRFLASRGVPVRPVSLPPLPVRFGADGLVPVVVRDVLTREVLTVAYANAEALERTRLTGLSHFFSRSRQSLWRKGETSGNVQDVAAISLDCDQDAVIYDVAPHGPACHTGADRCFTRVETLSPRLLASPTLELAPLFATVADRKRAPSPGSYTNRLLDSGTARVAKKVGEEGVEVALAAVTEGAEAFAGEVADLLYHLVVLMASKGVSAEEVERKLAERRGTRRVE